MYKSKQTCILWIDRWSKYIWLAYKQSDQNVVFPVWYVLNDKMMYFNISDVIVRHRVSKIIIWMPSKQEDIQQKIRKFIENLKLVIDSTILIETMDEDYTSVQSWEITSNFKKNVAEDTVSAMLILERRSTLQSPNS